jgi:hypothetical protein
MSPALIGGLAGLAVAIVDYFILGHLKREQERNGMEQRRLRAVDIARIIQLVAFPVIGFFAGPYIFASLGE